MKQQKPNNIMNSEVESKYEQHVMPVWKSLNVPVKSASGCTLTDFDGTEYLDMYSGISVMNVGHGNDVVNSRVRDQLDEFVHGCSYVHPNRPVAELAERLAEVTPGNLQKTFFCNSGTEAVEGAIKLARKYTGNKEIISLEMAFHGRTFGSLALTGNKAYKADMGPTLNDVVQTAPPYSYRCPTCNGGPCNDRCLANVERVIDTHTTDDIAAIIVEPIMGEGGIVVPPEGWLSHVREIAHDHGALFILDEVQTGYGRTGELWASDHENVTPDILTQAKGIANGLPLGAFTAPSEIADAFSSGDHLSTFGGNPVSCAAALATLDELENGIVENAREQGNWLDRELANLEEQYDAVGDTRGRGLMYGVELVDPSEKGPMDVAPAPDRDLASRVGERLREEHGVVMGVGGFYKNVVRIQPPLTISRDQLERAISALSESLETEVAR